MEGNAAQSRKRPPAEPEPLPQGCYAVARMAGGRALAGRLMRGKVPAAGPREHATLLLLTASMHTLKATGLHIELLADLRRWRSFLAVAELGSLTQAALFLETSQTALSRQINGLERDCGQRLFVRTGRGVALSEPGRELFAPVKAMLTEAESLETRLRAGSGELSGRVTVGMLPSIAWHVTERLHQRLHRSHPKVKLRVLVGASGQLEEWLGSAQIDLALLYRYGPPVHAGERLLAQVESYVVAPPGDARAPGAPLAVAELVQHRLVLPAPPNGLRLELDAVARGAGVPVQPEVETNSVTLMKSLVERSAFRTVLPLPAVWEELQQGRLRVARLRDVRLSGSINLASASGKGPRRIVNVVERGVCSVVESMKAEGMWALG